MQRKKKINLIKGLPVAFMLLRTANPQQIRNVITLGNACVDLVTYVLSSPEKFRDPQWRESLLAKSNGEVERRMAVYALPLSFGPSA